VALKRPGRRGLSKEEERRRRAMVIATAISGSLINECEASK